ncbi:MAG: argininosuccinate lyase [bacterium]
MSKPIWNKTGVDIDQEIMRFMAGEDILLDNYMMVYDIQASKAHVKGLASIRIITETEQNALLSELDKLKEAFNNGDFILDERYEDCHSAIEAWLTDKLGETGKKVHTGRSRNDQILVASRLYLRNALEQASKLCGEIAKVALQRAEEHQHVAMPGYTHLQRAVVSSAGMWFGGFAEAFIDNKQLCLSSLEWINSNPLGTAAGYGVNLSLNRELTTRELGFDRMQVNPIYAQNSRGKYELQTIMALSQCLLDVRRLAWDISLFSTAEFDFVSLPGNMTTGSSIMPNKRNPDLIELMRGAYAIMQGASTEIQSLLSLPSGYQRDLQFSKSALIRSVEHALVVLKLNLRVMSELEFKQDKMNAAISSDMFATDEAVKLVSKGMPFREAYQQIGNNLDQLEQGSTEQSLTERTSPGACADLMLEALSQRLEQLQS